MNCRMSVSGFANHYEKLNYFKYIYRNDFQESCKLSRSNERNSVRNSKFEGLNVNFHII